MSVRELCGFLGLSGYYRRFICSYGWLARPLTELLKKDGFKWSQDADLAFMQLKEALVNAPILALPNLQLPFTLETDASSFSIGVVLVQQGHPITFVSMVLSPRN